MPHMQWWQQNRPCLSRKKVSIILPGVPVGVDEAPGVAPGTIIGELPALEGAAYRLAAAAITDSSIYDLPTGACVEDDAAVVETPLVMSSLDDIAIYFALEQNVTDILVEIKILDDKMYTG